MGRNMFGPIRDDWDDDWTGWWGDEPPYHAPVFVLTHHEHDPIEMQGGTTFHFVTDGFRCGPRGCVRGRRRSWGGHRRRGVSRAAGAGGGRHRRADPRHRATVIFALVAAFILSMTLIPAMVAIGITGRVKEKEVFFVRWLKTIYAPTLRWALRGRWVVVPAAVLAFVASILLFMRLGQEFIPTLDEGNIAMHATRIASTGITQSSEMQFKVEKAIRERFPEVAFVFSKTGTAEMASDPMPPNVSDTFIMLKPSEQWRSEAELDRLICGEAGRTGENGAHAGGHERTRTRARRKKVRKAHGHGHGPPPTGHKGKLIKLMELELKARSRATTMSSRSPSRCALTS